MIFESEAGVFWLEPVPFELLPHTGRPRPTDFILGAGFSTDEMVSPSQADLFVSQCRRKWGFKYVEGRETPQTEAQVQGTKMHAQLERWLLACEPPQHPRLLKSGALARFPPPRALGLRAERAFVFALNWVLADGQEGRILWWGFKDAEQLPRAAARVLQVDGAATSEALPTGGAIAPADDAWHVYDLKTTADVAAWSKVAGKAAVVSPDRDLTKDTQALVYALGAFAEAGVVAALDPAFNPSDLQVVLHWVYVQTRGATISVTTSASPGDDGVGFDFFASMDAMVTKIPALIELIAHRKMRRAKTLTVLSMPATPTACGAYGGCPFRTECNDVSPIAVMTSLFAQKRLEARRVDTFSDGEKTPQEQQMTAVQSIVEKAQALAAKKAAAGGSSVPPPPAAVAAPAAAPSAAVSAKAALARFAKPAAAAAPAAAPAAPPAASSVLARVAAAKKDAEVKAAAAAVNQPPKKVMLDVDGIEVEAEVFLGVHTKKWRGSINELAVVFDEGETEEATLGMLVLLARKKIEQLQALEAAAAAEATAPPAEPVAPAPAPTPAPAPAKPRGRPKAAAAAPAAPAAPAPIQMPAEVSNGFALFLDVLPMKGAGFTDVETFLGPARAAVEAALGKNYRLADYSEGARLFAAHVQDSLVAEPPMGNFFASTRTLDKEVLEVLVRAANPVFKGVF